MRILGIESSCDETAAAVVEDGRRVISNVVNSQIDIHAKYGGVVPEVAARSHIEVVNAVIDEAVERAGGWGKIDAIAVTNGPGLIGSLMVGTLAARTYALLKNKPLYPVHHIEGHVYANFLEEGQQSGKSSFSDRSSRLSLQGSSLRDDRNRQGSESEVYPIADAENMGKADALADSSSENTLRHHPVVTGDGLMRSAGKNRHSLPQFPRKNSASAGSEDLDEFPLLALVVSGGHTQIVLVRGHLDFEIVGATRDDAVGEVFDKVAKILGLPYPGGPSIAKEALKGDRKKYALPKAKLDTPYDFSFSGLKTAVLRAVQKEVGVGIDFPSAKLAERLSARQRADFAAGFERVACEMLVDKLVKAAEEFKPVRVVLAGGVAANRYLREEAGRRLPCPVSWPEMKYCTDNGAMIAAAGYWHVLKKAPADVLELGIFPTGRG